MVLPFPREQQQQPVYDSEYIIIISARNVDGEGSVAMSS